MTMPTKKQTDPIKRQIHAALKAVHPGGIATLTFINDFGTCAKSRTGDLAEDGWQVDL